MTYSLLVMYHHPEDTEAFDRHYEQTHADLARALPGLRSFTGTHLSPDADGAPAPYYFVAVLSFDNETALQAAMESPEGLAAVQDVGTFAQAGVTLVNGPTITYL